MNKVDMIPAAQTSAPTPANGQIRPPRLYRRWANARLRSSDTAEHPVV